MSKVGRIVERVLNRYGFTLWFIFVNIAVTQLAIHEGIPRGYYSMNDIIIGNIIFYVAIIPFAMFNRELDNSYDDGRKDNE